MPAPLDEIAGYTLHEELGRGAMGVVRRATRDGEEFAVKLLRDSHLNAESIERFEREAELLCFLDHPNLVRGIEWGEEDGQHYFVLEYVRGRPIEPLALTGPLTNRATIESGQLFKILEQLEQVADALEYLHDHDVIHRDVKPDNILVDANGNARLVDLGVARNLDLHTITLEGDLVGTYHFFSPEQAMGGGRVGVDQRTDIFALGVTLYHCLTGRYPFDGETGQEILGRLLVGEYESLRTVRPRTHIDLDTIVSACLERRVQDRYANIGDVGRDLRRFRTRQPILRNRPSRWVRMRRYARKRAVPLLLAVLLVFVVFFIQWEHARRTANWAPVTFAESAGRDVRIEVELHPQELRGAPHFGRARTRPEKSVALPPNRIYGVTARDGDEERHFGFAVLEGATDVCFPFFFDPTPPEECGFLRLPGEPALWVRARPLTVGEAARITKEIREQPSLAGAAEWRDLHIFLAPFMDPPEEVFGLRTYSGEPGDALRSCSLTVASLAAAQLGGRLIGVRGLVRLVEHLEAGAPGWPPEAADRLRREVRHQVMTLTVVTQQDRDRKVFRLPPLPHREDRFPAAEVWTEVDPLNLRLTQHESGGFASSYGSVTSCPDRVSILIVRDE